MNTVTSNIISAIMFKVISLPGQQDKCFLCGQMGHLAANCEGKAKRKAGEFDEVNGNAVPKKTPYQVHKLYNDTHYLFPMHMI